MPDPICILLTEAQADYYGRLARQASALAA